MKIINKLCAGLAGGGGERRGGRDQGQVGLRDDIEDLGEKMLSAFTFAFAIGYKNVVIIGSDCIQLSAKIIEEAFELFRSNDVVIGPAKDGGYYLLGMNTLYKELF